MLMSVNSLSIRNLNQMRITLIISVVIALLATQSLATATTAQNSFIGATTGPAAILFAGSYSSNNQAYVVGNSNAEIVSFKSGTAQSTQTLAGLTHISDVQCQKSSDICIAAGNWKLVSYTVAASGALTQAWTLDIEANGTGIKTQKIGFLEGSDFLVALSNSEHGVRRIKLSDQTSATGSLASYLPSGLQVQDLEVVRDTLYALFTFTNWYQTFVVNMQTLKVVRKWSYNGLLAYFDKSPELMRAAVAQEQNVNLLIINQSLISLRFQ